MIDAVTQHGDVRDVAARDPIQCCLDARVIRRIVEHKEVHVFGVQGRDRNPLEDAADVTLGVIREDDDEDAACVAGHRGC